MIVYVVIVLVMVKAYNSVLKNRWLVPLVPRMHAFLLDVAVIACAEMLSTGLLLQIDLS